MWWRSRGWCCDGLREHFDRRYERGIFVFAEPATEDGRRPTSFWLAMRSVRREDMGRLQVWNPPAGLPLTILTWYPIWFCPWCGAYLARHYRDQHELLTDPLVSQEHGL